MVVGLAAQRSKICPDLTKVLTSSVPLLQPPGCSPFSHPHLSRSQVVDKHWLKHNFTTRDLDRLLLALCGRGHTRNSLEEVDCVDQTGEAVLLDISIVTC